MKTNKEVINALTDYFCKQDTKVVARTLAALMIDMNRMCSYESLPQDEKESLNFRVQKNIIALRKFAQNGPEGDLTLFNLETTAE